MGTGVEDNTDVVGRYCERKKKGNEIGLLDYCTINNLIIASTFYTHKEIYKLTRHESSGAEWSILVERNNRNQIRDVKVRRGIKMSDHYLLAEL